MKGKNGTKKYQLHTGRLYIFEKALWDQNKTEVLFWKGPTSQPNILVQARIQAVGTPI